MRGLSSSAIRDVTERRLVAYTSFPSYWNERPTEKSVHSKACTLHQELAARTSWPDDSL